MAAQVTTRPGTMLVNRHTLTTSPGYENRNGQIVIRNTGLPGTDHLQYIYELECRHCRRRYGANGTDIHERKCPFCQGGKPGLLYRDG